MPSVAELVKRFEVWEYSDVQKPGVDIEHRGQVSRIRAEIEDRLRALDQTQLVQIRRQHRRGSQVTTDYIEVEAYWDEETGKYWRQTESEAWEYYDEDAQVFKGSPMGGSRIRLPECSEDPELPRLLSQHTEDALRRLAEKAEVPFPTLLKFYQGVQLYAFVKANNGMLKPVTIHVSLDKGKFYIVRNTKSRFLSIAHFSKMDLSSNCLSFMDREAATNPELLSAVATIKAQHVLVLWTSSKFAEDTLSRSASTPESGPRSKSMCFVTDDLDVKTDLALLLSTTARLWNTPLKVTED